MRELWPFIRQLQPHLPVAGLGMLLGFLTLAAGVGLFATAGWLIAAAAIAGAGPPPATLNLFAASAAVRLCALVRTAARYGERLYSHSATLGLLATLRVWCYRHLEPLAPARLMAFRSGDLLNRLVADIDALDALYVRVLSPSAVALLATACLGVGLALWDPALGAVVLGYWLVAGLGIPWLSGRFGATLGPGLAARRGALRVGAGVMVGGG
ncbi:MAG: thiol reductant ABC exporter subunit CydC, partial [Candidatus Competibacterales bacterium]